MYSRFLIVLVLVLLIGGCAHAGAADVPTAVGFDDLVSNPQDHRGRGICTEGIYASGFEVSALGGSIYRDGNAVYLTEPVIWVEGAGALSKTNCLSGETIPAVEFCEAVVCGIFEHGEAYGHTGAYAYQISAFGNRPANHQTQ